MSIKDVRHFSSVTEVDNKPDLADNGLQDLLTEIRKIEGSEIDGLIFVALQKPDADGRAGHVVMIGGSLDAVDDVVRTAVEQGLSRLNEAINVQNELAQKRREGGVQ